MLQAQKNILGKISDLFTPTADKRMRNLTTQDANTEAVNAEQADRLERAQADGAVNIKSTGERGATTGHLWTLNNVLRMNEAGEGERRTIAPPF